MAGTDPLAAALGTVPSAPATRQRSTKGDPLAEALGTAPMKAAGSVVAGGASKLGQALDAPGWAVRRALTGESDTDKQMTKERSALGLEGAYQAAGKTPGVGHFLQGTADTLLQTAQDPLLALGPVARGLGLGAKAAGLLEKTAPGRLLQDATTWGAKVGREHGAEARDVARSASNIGKSTELGVSKSMERRIGKVRDPLSPEERMQVDRALNGEIDPATLAPNLLKAHNRLRQITDLDYYLRTGVKPKDYKTGLDAPYLGKYLPGVKPTSLDYENRVAKTVNRINPFDPRTLEREEFKVMDAKAGDEGFAAMAKNAGRQVGAQKIRAALGDLADSPEVQKLFDVKLSGKGTGRTEWEKVGSGIKSVVGYPRAAIVSLTPRHAGNILNLLLNTDPGALPEAMNLARKLAVANDKEYARLIKEGVDMGAVSGDFIERKPFFANVPGLGKWTTAMNKITWAVDDAAKTVYAKRIAAKEGGIDAFRYQRTPGAAQAGEHRGGTFYAMGKPGAKDAYKQEEWMSKLGLKPVGGEHKVEGKFAPKNPLTLPTGTGHVGVNTLKAIYGENTAKELVNFFVRDAKGLANWNEAPESAVNLLREAGMVPKDGPLFGTTSTITPYEKFINGANEDVTLVLDRIGIEAAKAKGYDAIIARKGVAGKTDELVDLGARKVNPLAAGGRAARELVDYANVAPITEAARYVAPFATFRTSIPGAVAGGVARNPARAAFLNRATGGTMYGGEAEVPQGGGSRFKMYNPTADIGRMDPQGYARGSLGDVPRMAMNQTGMSPPSKTGRSQKDWWTYGEGLFPFKDHNGRWHAGSIADYATAGMPLGQDVLEAIGVGAFRPKGIEKDILQKVFGIGLK